MADKAVTCPVCWKTYWESRGHVCPGPPKEDD